MTRRRLVVRLLVAFVVVVLAAAAVVFFWFVPDYRTAFVMDTSAGADTHAIGRAVGNAADNAGSRDALSLRRFGGRCGDPASTSEVVGSGRRNGQRIGAAAISPRQSGKATLRAGILAAIDDFSGLYPFRGWTANRIVVVTSHGVDACEPDQEKVMRSIRQHVTDAGLDLEIRLVGYQVPEAEREPLSRLAVAAGAPAPTFTNTAPELESALRDVTTPTAPEATSVAAPTTTTTTEAPPPEPALIVVVVGGWEYLTTTVTTDAPGTKPCTVRNIAPCQFLTTAGGKVTLHAEFAGIDPSTEAPFAADPLWFGCDEGAQATATCTLTLDTGRVVCLGTTRDPEAAAAGCQPYTPRNPRVNIPLGTTEVSFPR